MVFPEQYDLIRKLARQFAQTELIRDVLDEVEDTGVFPEEIISKMAKAGLLGIKIPKSAGGQGGDHLAYVIVMEEIARISGVASIYISSTNSLNTAPILMSGTEEQIQKYVRPALNNEFKMAFALTEPGAGSDAGGMVTTAVRDGEYYILNGRKCFITMAPLAKYAIVFARTGLSSGVHGISAFVMDMQLPGVSCGRPEDKMGMRGCATSDIVLENVHVHKSEMLGEEGKGFINAMKTLDIGRIGVAAQGIGIAQGCLDEAISYAKVRKQFGKPLAKHQAIAFMIADMATKLQAAKELLYSAAVMKDKDMNVSIYCSMAKYFATEICNEIATKALQIHGGYGFIKDYKIERMYRDARVLTIYEGTSQVQQMVISGQLLK